MCPGLLESIIGINPKKGSDPNLDLSEVSAKRKDSNLGWSVVGGQRPSMASEEFEDNHQYAGAKTIDHSADILNIYAKLDRLESSAQIRENDNDKDVSILYKKLHEMKLSMTEVSNSNTGYSNGSSSNDALYQAQNEQRAQLASLERKIEDLCLALQVHKSSAEMMTDTMKHLYERTSEIEEELSQNGRQSEIL